MDLLISPRSLSALQIKYNHIATHDHETLIDYQSIFPGLFLQQSVCNGPHPRPFYLENYSVLL